MPKKITDTPQIEAKEAALAIVKTPKKVRAPKQTREAVLSMVGGVSTNELKQALVVQTEQRKLIQDFIRNNLVEGIDYGKIHVVKGCQAEERSRGSCDKDYHFSKSILFKPGQEKIFSLFGITDELEKDLEAYEMLTGVAGLVAYKCVMYRGDRKVGEGRGAATLGGTQNDPNSTIKKAEKRARMDACLSLGFSAYFTQDLDDPEYASQREMMNSKAAAEAERRDKDEFGLMPRDPALPIDNPERATLHRLILRAGFSDPDEILELLKTNGIADPHGMTSGQARDMMGKLTHSLFSAPVMPLAPEAPEEEEEPALQEPPQEEELVVDDDLKSNVHAQYEDIGLNARGKMWFMKAVAGKPFGDFDKLSDEAWRKAYDFVQGIVDGIVDVDDAYIAGLMDSAEHTVDYSEPTREQVALDIVEPTPKKRFPNASQLA